MCDAYTCVKRNYLWFELWKNWNSLQMLNKTWHWKWKKSLWQRTTWHQLSCCKLFRRQVADVQNRRNLMNITNKRFYLLFLFRLIMSCWINVSSRDPSSLKPTVVMIPVLPSHVASPDVITTPCGATSDDKVGILATLGFQCLSIPAWVCSLKRWPWNHRCQRSRWWHTQTSPLPLACLASTAPPPSCGQ